MGCNTQHTGMGSNATSHQRHGRPVKSLYVRNVRNVTNNIKLYEAAALKNPASMRQNSWCAHRAIGLGLQAATCRASPRCHHSQNTGFSAVIIP